MTTQVPLPLVRPDPPAASGYPRTEGGRALPQWRYLLSWALLWPMLNLIARQTPFLAGPARSEAQIKEGAAAGAGVDYHLAMYLLLAFQLLFILLYAKQIYALLLRNRFLIACLFLPIISCSWSGKPGNSLRMGISADVCLLFAAYLYARLTPNRMRRFIMFLGVISASLCVITALALPSYGIFAEYAGGAWQGICNHKNTLGVSMLYLLTPVFFVSGLTRKWRVVYAIFLLFLIGMSQSRGAWIDTAALLTCVGLMFLFRKLRSGEKWFLLITTGLLGAALLVIAVAWFESIAAVLGKDPSMSGRTGIYELAWECVKAKPILGYGYGGFWQTAPEATRLGLSIGWTNIGYAENGILELALQLGFVGVALVVLLIGRACSQALRLLMGGTAWNDSGWYLSILLIALLTNIDAGWLLVPGTLDWVLVVIACLGLNDTMRRHERAYKPKSLRFRAHQSLRE